MSFSSALLYKDKQQWRDDIFVQSRLKEENTVLERKVFRNEHYAYTTASSLSPRWALAYASNNNHPSALTTPPSATKPSTIKRKSVTSNVHTSSKPSLNRQAYSIATRSIKEKEQPLPPGLLTVWKAKRAEIYAMYKMLGYSVALDEEKGIDSIGYSRILRELFDIRVSTDQTFLG